jgi:outer membrane immunogenic protein
MSSGVALKTKFLSGAASAALALGMSAPAYAQSRPEPTALPNWNGFYLGAHAGAAFGHGKSTTNSDCNAATSPPGYFCTTAGGTGNAAAVNAVGTGKISDTGFNGGFQAGYNWQANQAVFGVEFDIGMFGLKGTRQATGAFVETGGPGGAALAGIPFTVGSTFETNWLATYRGRLGWAQDNLLFYVTGGGAVTRLKNSLSFSDTFIAPPGAQASGSGSATKNGWVLGAGIEWMLSRNWTVKAEYLHVDFGSISSSGTITNASLPGYSQGISTSTKLDADIVRLGLNYKF